MKESIIQQQICEYLSLRGIFYYSIPNESLMMALIMFKVPEKIRYRIVNFFKKMGLVPGIPDLQLILNHGKTIYIEVKNEKGKLSENQKRIHKILKNKGFDVYVSKKILSYYE